MLAPPYHRFTPARLDQQRKYVAGSGPGDRDELMGSQKPFQPGAGTVANCLDGEFAEAALFQRQRYIISAGKQSGDERAHLRFVAN